VAPPLAKDLLATGSLRRAVDTKPVGSARQLAALRPPQTEKSRPRAEGHWAGLRAAPHIGVGVAEPMCPSGERSGQEGNRPGAVDSNL
jgi:hypothetical protein